jgi:hypothetical protein
MKLDIERLAREAGFRTGTIDLFCEGDPLPFIAPLSGDNCRPEVLRFAALVLEEAAKSIDKLDTGDMSREDMESRRCADSIRALKGNK